MARTRLTFSSTVSNEYRKLLSICRRSEHRVDMKQIRTAFIMVCEHNTRQQEPVVLYSLKLAQIIGEYLELGTLTITSALLYKSVGNGSISTELIKKECHKGVPAILNDLTHIVRDFDTNNIEKDAENIRKLLLTSVSDIRVILIRLAEMLYLLKHADEPDVLQQKKTAKEAMLLYAPIAHKLGLYSLKSELEDLAFRQLEPDTYLQIERKLKDTALQRNRLVREFITPINEQLDAQGFDYEIKSRTKSVFSIWNKMLKQKVEFEEVFDVFAIRIIIKSNLKEEKDNCWKVFSIVTNLYQSTPERMRDWITVPKTTTGYESLHATVMEPGGKWVEVQIRTERMNEIAERGLAAHWKYKGHGEQAGFDEWLNRMREILETSNSEAIDELEKMNKENVSKEIFVFTPKGELRKLRRGATVLDFAYEIHSDVGNACAGARVNGRTVPIRHLLNNGDKVEIITQKNQKPKIDWLDFAISSKAQNKIRQALNEELISLAEDGKEILKRRLRNWKVRFTDILVNRAIEHLNIKSSIDFYAGISTGKIDLTGLKEFLKKEVDPETKSGEKLGNAHIEKLLPTPGKRTDELLIIDGKVKNVDYKLARCCNPIFGDDIFGFITVNEGIKIHRMNCPNANQMMDNYEYRLIRAQWAGYESNTIFRAGIKVKGIDEIGIISRITDVIYKDMKVNMQSIILDSNEGVFEGTIKLFVKDTLHLDALINKILKVKGVEAVSRVDVV